MFSKFFKTPNHHRFDPVLAIRKSAVCLILIILLAFGYLIMINFLENFVRIKLGQITIYVAIVMAAFIVFIFEPAKNSLHVWVDKVFFREKYAHGETLSEFNNLMSTVLDVNDFTRATLELLMRAFQASSVALFLSDRETNFVLHTCINVDWEYPTSIKLSKSNPVIKWLSEHQPALLDRTELEALLGSPGHWQKEKEKLFRLKPQFIAGIKMQNIFVGFFLLTKKLSGEPYTNNDRELLLTLASKAAMSINNARLFTEFQNQAVRDELTKLYNYRFFHEFLEKEVVQAERLKEKLAVIFLDLDLFKAYNDIFGHLAGDEALATVAVAITDSTRSSDVVARYGGDEFAVILPVTDQQQAFAVAERIRDAVRRYFSNAKYGKELLTVSLGVACYPDHGRNKEQLLSCADRALFQAKYSGRNRVSLYMASDGRTAPLAVTLQDPSDQDKEILRQQAEDAYISTIYTLAAAINARDNYTYKHSEMVTMYSVALADALGMTEEQKKLIRHAAMLHDIGKIGIPEYILNKPGALTPDEREIIQRHVKIAEIIINQTPYLHRVAPIILHHHEAYDGSGYPDGLKGEEIPLQSRILTISDSFHAMTSDRPYHQAMTKKRAVQQLHLLAGKQFDPRLVELFAKLLENNFYVSGNPQEIPVKFPRRFEPFEEL